MRILLLDELVYQHHYIQLIDGAVQFDYVLTKLLPAVSVPF